MNQPEQPANIPPAKKAPEIKKPICLPETEEWVVDENWDERPLPEEIELSPLLDDTTATDSSNEESV
jgi:hypothetical protein